jgi:hypothetical protein
MKIIAGRAGVKWQQILRFGVSRQLYLQFSPRFVTIKITIKSLRWLSGGARRERQQAQQQQNFFHHKESTSTDIHSASFKHYTTFPAQPAGKQH